MASNIIPVRAFNLAFNNPAPVRFFIMISPEKFYPVESESRLAFAGSSRVNPKNSPGAIDILQAPLKGMMDAMETAPVKRKVKGSREGNGKLLLIRNGQFGLSYSGRIHLPFSHFSERRFKAWWKFIYPVLILLIMV